ncbi:hypothetical protein [Agromyces sp. SYSU T00194]|uniref:hypothetical protein n=1 Tax=Agromyces chitinivorans TaxID=3158560 RepID=UPI003390F691
MRRSSPRGIVAATLIIAVLLLGTGCTAEPGETGAPSSGAGQGASGPADAGAEDPSDSSASGDEGGGSDDGDDATDAAAAGVMIVLRADRLEFRVPGNGVSTVAFAAAVDGAAAGIRGFLMQQGVDVEAIERADGGSYSWGGMTIAPADAGADAPTWGAAFSSDLVGDIRLVGPERISVGDPVDADRHATAYDCDGQVRLDEGSAVEDWELRAETDEHGIVTVLRAPVVAGTCG